MPMISPIYQWGKNRPWTPKKKSKGNKRQPKGGYKSLSPAEQKIYHELMGQRNSEPTRRQKKHYRKEARRLLRMAAGPKPGAAKPIRNSWHDRLKLASASELWWKIYDEYLISPEWKTFRSGILLERGQKCQRCPATDQLQVHHKTYGRVGKERPGDVEVLCLPCHEQHHGREFTRTA